MRHGRIRMGLVNDKMLDTGCSMLVEDPVFSGDKRKILSPTRAFQPASSDQYPASRLNKLHISL